MFNFFNLRLSAEEAPTYYFAKVEKSGVFFYLSADESHPLFEIPTSYFVKLTSDVNEDFFSAIYSDMEGFVKKSEIVPMQGEPVTPYAIASLRVFSLEGLGLYREPTLLTSDIISTVPYLSTNITYYGKKEGSAVPNKSNVWYYCKFTEPTTSTSGYLYSIFCDELTQIPVNNEFFPLITSPLFPTKPNKAKSGLSDVAKTFIILGVSLPCALIIYLLVKPTLANQNAKAKTPKRRRRHRDYFEFDENDLT